MKIDSHIKIRNAYQLLIERAEKYTPKEDACWVCYEDEDGNSETFEDMNDFTFCEDCIEKVLEKATLERTEDLPKGFVKFDYQIETMVEKDDFLNCEECGEMINCSNLWSKQEMEHWTELTEQQWVDTLKMSHSCFQLKKILDNTYGAVEKFPKDCLKIAEKIIKYYSK